MKQALNSPLLLISTLGILSLIGCQNEEVKVNTDYSSLQKSAVSEKPLETPASNSFSNYIKNGIRLRLTENAYPEVLALADSSSSSGTTSSFSTTNVHEIGVDEGDRLKYDGEYLYTVAYAGYSEPFDVETNETVVQKNYIRILSADPTAASTAEIARITPESDDVSVTDLYLRSDQNQLISIAHTQFQIWDALLIDSDWQWTSGKTQVQLYDVGLPSSPEALWNLEIEGNLEGTRRVGNRLYLVTRYVPNIVGIEYGATTDEDKEANEALILATPISDLLPHYQSNNGAIRSLVSASDCLVTQGLSSNEGYADVVTLTALDLDNQIILSSVCINTNVQGIYSSTSGFYIGGTSQEPWRDASNLTAIHKFDLNDGDIRYRASAALPGYLGWADPSFRMSELDNNLRVVTTDSIGPNFDPNHQLSILADNGSNELELIGQLPNPDRPEPIGKPGEDIFAVRFVGERAYIITFERIDPLYAIDLQNPDDPQIAGELEIPGFSRYLHPIGENWLLGVGHHVENERQQGVKLELYDVTDISLPRVANTMIFGGRSSSTEALYDLRSISSLTLDDGSRRITLPMDLWKSDSSGISSWQQSGLFAFELSANSSATFELDFAGKLIAESNDPSVNPSQSYPLNNGIGRSKLHDDAVFYLHGNEIHSSLWNELELDSSQH